MIRVEVNAGGRQVAIETDGKDPLAKVIASALRTWKATADATPPRPTLEASGMGFQIERVDLPTYQDDMPGIVRT